MKKRTKKNLRFEKISIAIITKLDERKINGGTEPISPTPFSALGSQCDPHNCN